MPEEAENQSTPALSERERMFRYHRPSTPGVARIEAVRMNCRAMQDVLEQVMPPGRYLSLAMTSLEQVSFWANKGIVLGDPESVVIMEPPEAPQA